MNYGEIKKTDIANGIGVRVTLFVSGCTRHCKNCFNAETWDFNYGKPFTKETEDEVLAALAPGFINVPKAVREYIEGTTLSTVSDPVSEEKASTRSLLKCTRASVFTTLRRSSNSVRL